MCDRNKGINCTFCLWYKYNHSNKDGSDYGVYPEDYETEEKYNEALDNAKTAWRITCEDGSDVGIDPDDYDTEEEYEEALSVARVGLSDDLNVVQAVILPQKNEGSEQKVAKKKKQQVYPNKRQTDTARYLKARNFVIYCESDVRDDIKKCKFILYSDTVAAKYLTLHDGFLYSQAVKENFDLPISIPDEDDKVITYFSDLIMELAEEAQTLRFARVCWRRIRNFLTVLPRLLHGRLSLGLRKKQYIIIGLMMKRLPWGTRLLCRWGMMEKKLLLR